MSRGQSQPRDQSVRRTLERCKTRATIEIIDVDQEKVDVVTVDAAETSHQGSGGSRTTRRNNCPVSVISIDDEDGGSLRTAHADAIGKEFCPASSSSPMSEESENDECLVFIKGGHPPFDSTECMERYRKVGSSVNRFGLGFSSESFSSESDGSEFDSFESIGSDNDDNNSDCEIVEDSSGNIREQWERAALKKKMSERVRFSSEDQSHASGSSADGGLSSEAATQSRVEPENCINKLHSDHPEEMPVESCLFHSGNVKENLSLHLNAEIDNFSWKMNADASDTGIKETVGTSEQCSNNAESEAATQSRVELENCINKLQSDHSEEMPVESCLFHSSNVKENLSFHLNAETDNLSWKMNADTTDTGIKETAGTSEQCSKNEQSEILPDNMRFGFHDSETVMNTSVCHLNLQHDPKTVEVGIGSLDMDEEVSATDSGVNKQSTVCNHQPFYGKQFSPVNIIHNENKHRSAVPSFQLQCDTGASSGVAGFQEKDASSSEPPSLRKYELQAHSDLICERERHKESDEYRRAVEEEWAARQLQLQIQAEEAQKLRKRRKAETLRLLDMERRQKQRLEEVRESQKKDEETINMKEQLRAEVRKDLEMMEQRYRDMASLLRALGVHVEGGYFPRPHEVNAAYKQALLRFHPDRASRSDIRQQVKAEETFKLISRLKAKLLPTM